MSERPDFGEALARWASERAPELLARAEDEAVAVLRDALVGAALPAAQRPSSTAPAPPPEPATGPAPPPEPVTAPEPPPEPEPEPVTAPGSATDSGPVAGELLWAYCVIRGGDPDPLPVAGIAEGEVQRVASGDLTGLVSAVPASEFAAEPLRHNLNDLAWLERVARGHEAVMDAALRHATIVPLRMCTIFESEAGVREMLETRRDSLGRALDALDGRLEWAVKVLVDRDRLMEAARPLQDEDDQATSAGEGGAYLQRRRAERGTRQVVSQLAADTAARIHARLQDWAIDARTRPPQNRELSGHEGEMVLNAAYLVERERSDELRRIVAELEDHHRQVGARIELSGPWPPYNFVPDAETETPA